MTVLQLNRSDSHGGAARAAYRLHSALRELGTDSRMIVQTSSTNDKYVYHPPEMIQPFYNYARSGMSRLPLYLYPERDSEIFSPAWLPEFRSRKISNHNPDITHLHWITRGYMQPKTITKFNTPVVWTLHDMWPFTGGCHYSKLCRKFEDSCGACPHLKSKNENDLSRSVWKRKRSTWESIDFTVVTPSKWLAAEARRSSLFSNKDVEVIPNGVDLDVFCPRDRSKGIEKFNLDPDTKYILTNNLTNIESDSPRKGGDLLFESLTKITSDKDISLLLFGEDDHLKAEYPLPITNLGRLSETELRLAYSTADVTAVPSRQDNLPNVAVESVASGTPCIGFDIGGIPEIITHKKTGYVADPFDTEELARGIEWIIADQSRLDKLSKNSRKVAERRFALSTVANQYIDLYNRLC